MVKEKRIIDQYTDFTICMFRITNIEEINKNYKIGNEVIRKISEYVRNNIYLKIMYL